MICIDPRYQAEQETLAKVRRLIREVDALIPLAQAKAAQQDQDEAREPWSQDPDWWKGEP
jgi:hypothetical protein